MNSRLELTNKLAVVLHSSPYRNSSLIIHFFLKDYGKVSAIAKGVKAKKIKNNQSLLLQPFNVLSLSLIGREQYELLILKNVERVDNEVTWNLSGKALYCAYYLNELLLRLLPSQIECADIFSLYNEVLVMLSHSEQALSYIDDPIAYEIPLRIFEYKLLELLGYGLNVSHDIYSDKAINEMTSYYYQISSGPSEKAVIGEPYLLISGKTLIALSNLQFLEKKVLQEAKQLLKWAIAEHLGDKPLKSREIFKQLYQTSLSNIN